MNHDTGHVSQHVSYTSGTLEPLHARCMRPDVFRGPLYSGCTMLYLNCSGHIPLAPAHGRLSSICTVRVVEASMHRSYHGENTRSHQHTAVKHRWARLVLWSGTTGEPLVSMCFALPSCISQHYVTVARDLTIDEQISFVRNKIRGGKRF